MEITYLGHSSFRLKGKNATVITDPFDPKTVGLKFPKVSADIVTVSHSHSDHNQLDRISDVKRVFSSPGEYEVMGVSILGFRSFHDATSGSERGKNTIFVFEMDDLRLAHLGDLGHELSGDAVNEMGTVDILMIPVGGFYTIDPEKAAAVVREIEPSIIIPMHYKATGMNDDFSKLSTVEDFTTLTGIMTEKMEKLVVKKADIPEEGQKIIILEQKK